jgi:hypothetical protein
LKLAHTCYLHPEFMVDAIDLDLDDLEQSLAARRFFASRTLGADGSLGAFRACESFASPTSGFPNRSASADSPLRPGRTLPTGRARRTGNTSNATLARCPLCHWREV